jgi:hypothetical protein
MVDNTTQEARILTNDLNNVATAAAAASTHLNSITSNNTSHNITNANIQAGGSRRKRSFARIWREKIRKQYHNFRDK